MADIFVSHTSTDRAWVDWIGQELEKLGHKPHIDAWEIKPGESIYAWMEKRLAEADYVLCVLTDDYLDRVKAPFAAAERDATLWEAARRRPGFALLVVVKPCEVPLLAEPLRRCELHGLMEDDARKRFVDFLEPQGRPPGPAPFPGPRPAVAFPGGKYALSNIPISVPLHFLGRDDELKSIKAALARGDGRVAITALHGLRGVGKTTLAAAYAERHRGDYRATWWMRAQTPDGMRADLVALGVRLDWIGDEKEEAALAAVLERLRHEGDGILLIFDNAIDEKSIGPYLPRRGTAQIIVTSNSDVWRRVASPVEIEVWPKETGADYLTARTGRDNEREAALALSEALGGLPLAHEQAAAYCERLGVSLAEYSKRFTAAPARLLADARDASREYHDGLTVAKTFALAIDEAAKLHPAAEPLIVHAALLAPEPIPLYLFAEARDKFGEPFASALAGDGLDEAVGALRGFALIDRETIADEREPAITTDCIRLHRLVHQVAATRREGEMRDDARRALVRALAAIYPRNVYDDPASWPRARRLDALAAALLTSDGELPEGTERQAADILEELGAYRQYTLAAYQQARPLFERTLALREKALGPEDRDTCVSISYLALLLRDSGDFAGAKPLFERALRIIEKVCGPDHPDTATCLNNLALVLRAQGDLATARALYERALAIDEKALGAGHAGTATDLNNLAFLLKEQGDLAAARPLFERALAIDEKASGHEHPATATSLVNLAGLLLAEGDAARALPMFLRALAIREKVLVLEHPSTKNAALHTAVALEALSRGDEANALREKYGL